VNEPITVQRWIEVIPHPSEKRPGFIVLAIETTTCGDSVVENSRVLLDSFRRVKSNPNHRREDANQYALTVGKFFGMTDIRIMESENLSADAHLRPER
jgi:hypothetical protein